MRDFFVGVDVSKAELVCRVLDEKGQEQGKGSFTNGAAGFRKLKKFLLGLDIDGCFHVGMEATGVYHRNLALFLYNSGERLVPGVFNPASVKAFGQSRMSRTKTDGQDALILARYTLELFRDGTFRPWEPERPEVAQLQQLVSRREQLVSMKVSEQNRLHALEEDGGSLPFLVESVRDEILHLEDRIREVEKMIGRHMEGHPKLKADKDLLISIPGIGQITAATWMGHLGDLSRFGNPSQIVAHIGIAPRERQSGSSVRGKPQICRTGLKELRCALYLPVMAAATRLNPVLKSFYERLVTSGKRKKAALIACMNKLVHIIWAIMKSRQPFDPNYALARN